MVNQVRSSFKIGLIFNQIHSSFKKAQCSILLLNLLEAIPRIFKHRLSFFFLKKDNSFYSSNYVHYIILIQVLKVIQC